MKHELHSTSLLNFQAPNEMHLCTGSKHPILPSTESSWSQAVKRYLTLSLLPLRSSVLLSDRAQEVPAGLVSSPHCSQISALISYMLGTDRLGTAGAVARSMLPEREEGTRTWPPIAFLSRAMWGVVWLCVVPAQRPGGFGCTAESSRTSHRDCPSKSKCLQLTLLMFHF